MNRIYARPTKSAPCPKEKYDVHYSLAKKILPGIFYIEDSLILTGSDLLQQIESDYPGTSDSKNPVEGYVPLQSFMGDLQNALIKTAEDRLRSKKPNQDLKPISGTSPSVPQR